MPPMLPDVVPGRGPSGLHLRRWRHDDAAALAAAVAGSIEHLRPWMSWIEQEPLSVADRRALIGTWNTAWNDGGDALYGMFLEDVAAGHHRVAGGCGLHRRRGPGVLEIGYWVHPSYVRRGIATAASRLLTEAAFAVDGIERVEIHHDRANVASGGVPRRLGYRFVGETPCPVTAPAETGVDCTWAVDRAEWEPAAAVSG